MEMFEVGGCVRDELLGRTSKDIDFTVVMGMQDMFDIEVYKSTPFEWMVETLRMQGFKIFLESPQFFTVRAQFPKDRDVLAAMQNVRSGLTADFVLARKERGYADGRRPDSVEVGTLEDDLARRDFTMNAIAKAADGSLVDPFNGQQDIRDRIIRAVGNPRERLREDALRALRALRFSLTLGFRLEGDLEKALMFDSDLHDAVAFNISDERKQQEVNKMFAHDTLRTLHLFHQFPALTGAVFSGRLSLEATLKQRK